MTKQQEERAKADRERQGRARLHALRVTVETYAHEAGHYALAAYESASRFAPPADDGTVKSAHRIASYAARQNAAAAARYHAEGARTFAEIARREDNETKVRECERYAVMAARSAMEAAIEAGVHLDPTRIDLTPEEEELTEDQARDGVVAGPWKGSKG